MKSLIPLIVAFALILAITGPCAAEQESSDASVGESIGKGARQVADDSTEAYNSTKDAIVQISRDVVKDAKKAFQEAKKAGVQVADDVKKGFSGKEDADEDK